MSSFLRSALRARTVPRYNNTAFRTTRTFTTTLPNMVVHNVNTLGEFKAAIADHEKVLVDCFATWCGPCKAIAPILADMSNQEAYKDVYFIKLDVDEVPDAAQELGVKAMPTFYFFKNGEKVDDMMGANPAGLKSKAEALLA
ncbi:thioredoxin-like protein [Emericellopsis atlantica]|uniref:Thioredoxin-like protein n=1 Tax=Emericellopsis atlantica TaxID=2614577 RepID=A0A9P8CLZ2_9HYPO|nr:thioredoxin-like protein [Emericellopsis atlantica]KAG9251923.1 thioredoxin-like protein [Emericellopsis atlantica]